jgi:membrane protein YqaA with SNARE-associated domain
VKALLATLIAWGPLGLFLFAVIDGAGVPTPNGLDALLLLLTINRPSFAYGFAAITLVGSLIGCVFLFYMARKGGEATLKRYRCRPRFVKLELWFQHYGLLTIFIPALLPIPLPLKFFILCAGVFEVRLPVFIGTLLLARIPRYLALAYLGAQLGNQSFAWLRAHKWNLLAFALVLFLFLYLLIKVVDRRRRLTAQE